VPAEISIRRLHRRLTRLRDSLEALRLNASHDGPAAGEHMLVDSYAEAAQDAVDWVDRATELAASARRHAAKPGGGPVARESLAACNSAVNQATKLFMNVLACHETVGLMAEFGQKNNGEWMQWAECLAVAVPECRKALLDVDARLLACWRDLSGFSGSFVSVRTTAVGQRLAARESGFAHEADT
jgi:hypothetical protein